MPHDIEVNTATLTRQQRRRPTVARSPAAGERFPPGTLLAGRYRVTHALGRGGMGEVYRADDRRLGVPVALKLLPADLTQDENLLSLLLNEARLARAITHKNVCRIHDVGESEGLHFISMELVGGEDLAALLRRIGRLPQDKAIDVARGICAGLDAAHGEGILHRDLKPANLMIDETGEVRITDFGISLHMGDAAAGASTGSPAYMAPEQSAGGEVSVRTDLYALGLVLYELFTGRRAFKAPTTVELARLHREVAPTPPSALVRELDPAIEKVILRCLEKDPRRRPASAQAVASALPGRAILAEGTVLKTLLVSDLVGSTRLAESLGDAGAADLFERHDRLTRDLLLEHGGREIDKTDGFLLLFERPIHAVLFACAYHQALAELSLQARIGIHLGELVLRRNPSADVARGAKLMEVEGLARPMTARLMALSGGRQTLMTRAAFDVARRSAVDETAWAERLSWLAHGRYLFKGVEEPVDVFEVGEEGRSLLQPPPDSEKSSRVLGEDLVLGWRPAPGRPLPGRPRWTIDRKLGAGGFGEVWLAVHGKTRERRVFKFCYETSRLRGLQREITLFRLLKEELGEREDIARILDWNFDQAPYFVESEYTAGGDLVEWATARGGIGEVPLGERLEIIAQVADALAAAHSVGVLHKDVKPANVLIWRDAEGRTRTRLTDFGIGAVTDPARLAEAGITALGLSGTARGDRPASGTRLYMAPELIEGKAATVQADVYALGVMLYQVLTGDLGRALAPGWQREIDDQLLREDVAAAVDGDAERRLSGAADLARRLRRLAERRQRRRAEEQLKGTLERVHRRRRQAIAVAAVLAVVTAVVAVAGLRVRKEAQRARDLARAAVAGNLLAEGRTTLGNLVALEVRTTPTAAEVLRKALRQPVYLATVEGYDAAFLPDSWSPDGSRLLAVSLAVAADDAHSGPTLRICDARTGGELRRLRGHTETILGASWSADGRRVLTVSDQTVRVWDAGSGEQLLVIDADTAFHDASWSGDGSRVLTVSGNNAAVWDAAASHKVVPLVRLVGHTGRIYDASWNGDGWRVLTASADHTARVWDARTGDEITRFEGHTDTIRGASWSGDGTRVLTVSADLTARVWDGSTGEEIAHFEGHQTGIHSASWNGDGHRVLTASWDTARIWDSSTGEEIQSLLGHSDVINSAAWSHDGRRVLTASSDRTARIWDGSTGKERDKMEGHPETVSAATWSHDDALVLAVSWEAAARIWNTRTGEEAARMEGHTGAVLAVSWSADGSRVLTASDDMTARIWDARTGRETVLLEGHDDLVSSAVWSGDGRRVLTASDDRTARIWDGSTGQESVLLKGHTDILSSAVWSGDGGRVLTASWDGTARIWDAGSGEELVLMDGQTDTFGSASWTADDTQVLFPNSPDGTVRTWNARSGEEIAGMQGQTALRDIGDIADVAALSPDGRRVVRVSGHDPTARVWVTEDEDLSYLRGRVRARTRICLDGGFRQAELGESDAAARRDTEVCEKCVPVFFEHLGEEPAPWESYAEAWRVYASCLGS